MTDEKIKLKGSGSPISQPDPNYGYDPTMIPTSQGTTITSPDKKKRPSGADDYSQHYTEQ